METIANSIAAAEQEGAPPGEERPSVPLSGKVLEPPASVRNLATLAGDPFDVTVTTAPRYNGRADQVVVRRSWAPISRKLADLGLRRYLHSFQRGEAGAVAREPVQMEIQRAWRTAAELGMPMQTIADLLGVTRQAVYNIIESKVAGREGSGVPESERPPLPPVKWPQAAIDAHHRALRRAELARKSRPWTDDEVQVLRNRDLTDKECAAQLDRPVRGVHMKRRWLALREAQVDGAETA